MKNPNHEYRYQIRKAAGVCIDCKAPVLKEGSVRCDNCRTWHKPTGIEPVIMISPNMGKYARKIGVHIHNCHLLATNIYFLWAGGAAVYLDLSKRKSCTYHLRDPNPHVVNFWLHLRDKPGELIAAVADLSRVYDNHTNRPGVYRYFRGEFNLKERKPVERSALFYMLCALCRETRFNKALEFNGSHLNIDTVVAARLDRLQEISEHIQGITVAVQDLAEIQPTPMDLVYLEPPFYTTDKRLPYGGKVPTLEELAAFVKPLTCRWVIGYADDVLAKEVLPAALYYRLLKSNNGLSRKSDRCACAIVGNHNAPSAVWQFPKL